MGMLNHYPCLTDSTISSRGQQQAPDRKRETREELKNKTKIQSHLFTEEKLFLQDFPNVWIKQQAKVKTGGTILFLKFKTGTKTSLLGTYKYTTNKCLKKYYCTTIVLDKH